MCSRGLSCCRSAATLLALLLAACGRAASTSTARPVPVAARPAVIPLEGGERVWLDSSRFTLLKIDDRTVGARHFALGSEDIPPGSRVPVHRHHRDEELIIVHRGRIAVTLADRESVAGPGGVVFIPPETWVGVRSMGPDTATVFFVFPALGFTDYFRALGGPARGGRSVSDTNAARINATHAIEYRRP